MKGIIPMLSTISAFRPTISNLGVRPAKDDPPAPAPAPTPAPGPTDPTPDIDFTNVDTPEKASLLPALNATSLLITVQALSDAGQGGLALTSALQMTLGQSTQANVNYQMSDPSTLSMSGTGTYGNAQFSENWAINPNDGSLSITGNVGNSQQALKMTGADDGTHIDGTIGSMDVHEVITTQGDGDDAKLVWDGTVGGKTIHQELSIKPDANQNPVVHVEGKLGDAGISTDATATSSADQNTLNLNGQGTIAGNAIQYNHSITFATPAPPPDPGPTPTPDPNPAPSPAPPPSK